MNALIAICWIIGISSAVGAIYLALTQSKRSGPLGRVLTRRE